MPLSDGMHKNAYKEILMPANQDLTFMFNGAVSIGPSTYKCDVPVRVNVEENKNYEFNFRYFRSYCYVSFEQIDKNENGQYMKRIIKKFTNKMDSFNDECIKKFKSVRWFS